MSHRITFAPAAVRQLRQLDPPARRRNQAAIELLAEHPRPPRATRLTMDRNRWRVSTGDFRIVYEIDDDTVVVLVVAIGHRREIYDRLS